MNLMCVALKSSEPDMVQEENSKSYPKEVGEYDYEYSSFPIHIFLFMGFVCCFQNALNSFVTGSLIVAIVYTAFMWFNLYGTLLFPIWGIYESIRILSNSKRNSFLMIPAKYEWVRITVCCIFIITFCHFMTL